MMTCLKYFLPIGCALVIGVGLWQLYLASAIGEVTRYALAGASVLFALGVGLSLFRPVPGEWKRA